MLPFCEKGTPLSADKLIFGARENGAKKNEDIEQSEVDPLSPYLYELFAVIIHSGGAYGGHYHAHIRDVLSTEDGSITDEESVKATRLTLQRI
jgi:ubiquitin C-terminal hydrolase